MAAKINAGEVGRGDRFFIDPVEIVVGRNSRRKQFIESGVLDLLASFERVGQLQPVKVRKIADNKVQLVFGFNRHEAARRFNELHPEKKMKLQCVLADCNEEEAFAQSIEENLRRSPPTPIDAAHAQRELREQYGWTEAKIAELYGCTTSYLSLLRKLLALPNDTQELVDQGNLSVNAAVKLSDLASDDQKEVLQVSMQEVEAAKAIIAPPAINSEEPSTSERQATPLADGKPVSADLMTKIAPLSVPVKKTKAPSLSKRVTKNVREIKISHGQKQTRTVSEIREFFLEYESTNPTVISFAGLMLQYIGGSISDKTMRETLEQLA